MYHSMKKKLVSVIFLLSFFTSCSIFSDKNEEITDSVLKKKRIEPNIKEAQRKAADEGGLVLFGNRKNLDPGESSVLWKATLQALDFIPIANASYGGGIIITDWYKPKDNLNSSIKITVKFLSPELSVSSIDVDAFEKKCNANDCSTKKMSLDFNQKIKLSIIEKAKEISLKKEKNK
jgi:hypothetical protein